MPMGPFRDFEHCLQVQQGKGHSIEAAKRICGAIKSRVEGGNMSVDQSLQAEFNKFLWNNDVEGAKHRAVSPRADGTCPKGFKKVGNRCEPVDENNPNPGGTEMRNHKTTTGPL